MFLCSFMLNIHEVKLQLWTLREEDTRVKQCVDHCVDENIGRAHCQNTRASRDPQCWFAKAPEMTLWNGVLKAEC